MKSKLVYLTGIIIISMIMFSSRSGSAASGDYEWEVGKIYTWETRSSAKTTSTSNSDLKVDSTSNSWSKVSYKIIEINTMTKVINSSYFDKIYRYEAIDFDTSTMDFGNVFTTYYLNSSGNIILYSFSSVLPRPNFVDPDWLALKDKFVEFFDLSRVIYPTWGGSWRITMEDFLGNLTKYSIMGKNTIAAGLAEITSDTRSYSFEFDLAPIFRFYNSKTGFYDILANNYNYSIELRYTAGGLLEYYMYSTKYNIVNSEGTTNHEYKYEISKDSFGTGIPGFELVPSVLMITALVMVFIKRKRLK
ncbi:MAG: Heimdall-CTERM domain-containing surface protein [Candidatus Hodarchaeales archaeon]|jgi:hypothetical protein